MPDYDTPRLEVDPALPATINVRGAWQIHALAQPEVLPAIEQAINKLSGAVAGSQQWDLTGVTGLDHIGAQVLWTAWGKSRPAGLQLDAAQEKTFARLQTVVPPSADEPAPHAAISWQALKHQAGALVQQFISFVGLIGQLMLDLKQFILRPLDGPWKEISANVYHAGFQALGITALVGFLIGVVLSYLSAQQLHSFGGDIYLVNILGMSIIRELGPLLAAILVAGRSGSSMTAQLGVMRVTEELDAMLVMGMPHGFRLVMPKVLALAVAMPLLVIWTDGAALLGGMMAAMIELNLSPVYFVQKLPDAVPLANYTIGLAKGAVFGSLIALVACHFGLRIKANTESLGQGTTTSVVTAITVVILADAVFAIVFNGVGF